MIIRPAKLGVVFALAVAGAIACAGESKILVPEPRPGGPAYWESNVPSETKRVEHPPHPASASATPPGMRPEGTTDKFLWQEATDTSSSPVTPPDSQTPLKPHDKVDGGADGGDDATPP